MGQSKLTCADTTSTDVLNIHLGYWDIGQWIWLYDHTMSGNPLNINASY